MILQYHLFSIIDWILSYLAFSIRIHKLIMFLGNKKIEKMADREWCQAAKRTKQHHFEDLKFAEKTEWESG